MEEALTLTVSETHAGLRADKILALTHPELSRTSLQKLFESESVLVAGEPIEKNEILRAGEILEYPSPTVLQKPLEAREVPFDILYEDKNLFVINKPAGIAVHPVSSGDNQTTIAHGVLAYLGEAARKVGPPERPCIVHRLDKDTTGALLLAKTPRAFEALKKLFAARAVHKEYLAVVRGVPELLAGSITEAIGRSPRHPLRMCVREDGRESRTDWERLSVSPKGDFTVLRCILHTGRTHQARVHLAQLGHPVLGDASYGYKGTYQGRTLLHAHRLSFAHPMTGKTLSVEAPPPADMQGFLHL